jgi:hypothetical protein
MLRRLTMIAGTGVALVSAASVVAQAAAGGSGSAGSRHAPPAPRVSTLGITRSADLVSYCWSYSSGAGTHTGVCADGAAGRPTHTLRWRPDRKIVVDFRIAAHDVGIQAVKQKGQGVRPQDVIQVHVSAADSSGKRWLFRLPRSVRSENLLLIGARFAHGDADAELGIRRARASSTP